MQTYILPSMEWAPLLQIIINDARAGDIIEVHTAEMVTYAQQGDAARGADGRDRGVPPHRQRGSTSGARHGPRDRLSAAGMAYH